MVIKVKTIFTNSLFSEAIRRLLEGDEGFEVLDLLGSSLAGRGMESLRGSIVLTDLPSLHRIFPGVGKEGARFILIDTSCGEERLVTAVREMGVMGVLRADSTPRVLKRAIRAVFVGEVWLERDMVKTLVYGREGRAKEDSPALSGREREIAALVGGCYRNREIAERLKISEPTVKAHIHHIFQKLNLRTRTQLVSFAHKGRLR